MKKVLFALCTVLMLTTACKKDNDGPENLNPSGGGNQGGGTEQPETIPTGEGIFNPAQKIVSISIDGEASEVWVWTDSMLTAINTADEMGALTESSTFTYNNYRVTQMNSRLQGMPFTANYSYSNDKLASVTATANGMPLLAINFTHNADKVSHLSVDVNSMLLALISEMFGNGMFDFFDWFNLGKGSNTGKWSIDDVTINADMNWQGDNVSQVLLSTQLSLTATLGEIRKMINLDSLLGSTAYMLSALPDTTSIPLNIEMQDTLSYSYDTQHNPFYGFLGSLDPTTFSANNVTASTSSATAIFSATLNISYLTIPVSFPYPLGSTTKVFTYTYNTAGFPTTVTDSEGTRKEYLYLGQ